MGALEGRCWGSGGGWGEVFASRREPGPAFFDEQEGGGKRRKKRGDPVGRKPVRGKGRPPVPNSVSSSERITLARRRGLEKKKGDHGDANHQPFQ